MLGALWITSTSADTTLVRCTVDTPPHPQVVQILFGVCAYILLGAGPVSNKNEVSS